MRGRVKQTWPPVDVFFIFHRFDFIFTQKQYTIIVVVRAEAHPINVKQCEEKKEYKSQKHQQSLKSDLEVL